MRRTLPPPDPDAQRSPSPGVPVLLALAEESSHERSKLPWFLAVAAVLHVPLMFLGCPEVARPDAAKTVRPVTVVRNVRFEPPPPPPPTPRRPPREARATIPVPDPTPDDLEPLRPLDEPLPEPVWETESPLDFVLPEPPPAPPAPPAPVAPADDEPVELDGSIVPPVKRFAPQPQYTEPARRVRIEGPVILRAVIRKDGTIGDVRVLRSLPLGLTESAVETVATWRYQPATRRGKPVAVFLNLRVDFSLN